MTITIESIKKECLKTLECEDEQSIKKCYYKLALRWHPDRNPQGEETFKKIKNAYDILSNEETLQKEYKERIEKEERENVVQQKIKAITTFLDANECQYEKEDKSLHYYEKLMNKVYDKIFYLLQYEWEYNWKYLEGINNYVFRKIRNIIFNEKRNILCLYNISPYQLNLNNVYLRAFLLHVVEERLYTRRINNNQLVDLLNFLEYSLEKTPAWNILI